MRTKCCDKVHFFVQSVNVYFFWGKDKIKHMNIAFFLHPKSEIISVSPDATLRQVLERMEFHRYTAIPIVAEDGQYAGTVTEGDLLWHMKINQEITFENAHRHALADVLSGKEIHTVSINAEMSDMLKLVRTQNFVPVIDDAGVFIGIVRRSAVIDHFAYLLTEGDSDDQPSSSVQVGSGERLIMARRVRSESAKRSKPHMRSKALSEV